MNQLRILVADRSVVSEHVFRDGPVVLGRLPTNDIQLGDPRASRIHVELSWLGDTLTVRDVGSGNGTFIVRERSTQELFSASAHFSSGEVELHVGGTIVRANLERVRVAFVPEEVVDAARSATEHLRQVRATPRPSHAGPGTPERASDLLSALSTGLATLRTALQATAPHERRRRTAQPPDAATNALLTWTQEAMAAVASAVFALDHVLALPEAACASPVEEHPSGVQLCPDDAPEPTSDGAPTEAERTTSVTRRPRLELDTPRPLRG